MEGDERSSDSSGPALRLQKTKISENKDENNYEYWCIFGGNQFAEGNVRRVYKGVYCGIGPKNGKICLVKLFKQGKAKELMDIAPDLAVSVKAAELAQEFNEVLMTSKCTTPFRPIKVEIPLICEVEGPVTRGDLRQPEIIKALKKLLDVSSEADLKRKMLKLLDNEQEDLIPEFVAVEQFLEGKWYKFNSNCGHEDQTKSIVMPAFSHWTWEHTNNEYLFCDLQGVKRRDNYLLTDPAIHSLDGNKYGSTDLGIGGMARVMQFHECNFICWRLGLENEFADEKLPDLTGVDCTTHCFTIDKLPKEVEQKFKKRLVRVEE